jgi:hypothetical protein
MESAMKIDLKNISSFTPLEDPIVIPHIEIPETRVEDHIPPAPPVSPPS